MALLSLCSKVVARQVSNSQEEKKVVEKKDEKNWGVGALKYPNFWFGK